MPGAGIGLFHVACRGQGPGGAAPFSPLSLFASGEEGAWYDPSDLTALFQDAFGTTPVTADSQPVRLMLDKSKGLVPGSELVTNGTFDTDTTGWSSSGSGLTSTVVSGELVMTSGGSFGFTGQAFTCEIGKTYRVTCQARRAAGTGNCFFEASNSLGSMAVATVVFSNTDTATLSITFKATLTTHWVRGVVSNISGQQAAFDNISVRELPGNHATAPSDAARPLYRTAGGLHWLEFDGVDDSMSTAAIDFTAGDKITIGAAASKPRSTTSMIAELSVNAGTAGNAGSFYFLAGNDAGFFGYASISRGDAVISSSLATGITIADSDDMRAVAIRHSITPPLSSSRFNGAAGGTSTAAKGTGNFGNYPLYIGSRGGAVFRYLGKLGSLVIVGAEVSADVYDNLETYVAEKAGVTLP